MDRIDCILTLAASKIRPALIPTDPAHDVQVPENVIGPRTRLPIAPAMSMNEKRNSYAGVGVPPDDSMIFVM